MSGARTPRLTGSTTSTILGSGMLATALAAYAGDVLDAVLFACGVSDSTTADAAAYLREASLLDATIRDARGADSRLVYFSSGGAVYGPTAGLRDEGTPLRPATAYGHHKVAMEARIRASGVRYLIVRFPNLVGPRQNGAQLVPSLVRQALDGHVTIQRHATRDLLDVDDAARLVADLLRLGGEREVIQVASGVSTPVAGILDHIVRILDVRPSVDVLDAGEAQRFDERAMRTRLGGEPLPILPVEQVLARHVPSLATSLRPVDA